MQGGKRVKTIFSFFKPQEQASIGVQDTSTSNQPQQPISTSVQDTSSPNEPQLASTSVEIDLDQLERDPGLRKEIWKYNVNLRDEVRQRYISMGPYQPILSEYPPTICGKQNRYFNSEWFKSFCWLEYSPARDAVYCFPCFLFEKPGNCNRTFTYKGFDKWKRVGGFKCAFVGHEGVETSPHSKAVTSMECLINVSRHIDKVMLAQTSEEIKQNRFRLMVTVECVRWLTLQGCALRGHDESESSQNQGNFVELLEFLGRMNVAIYDALKNAQRNTMYKAHTIQKEVLLVFARIVRMKICEEIGDAKFCILVDEAKDMSNKEQMAIVLRYVDVDGFLKERFFEIVEVANTSSLTLKNAISDVLSRHDLHSCNMRGQGYDGASNMSGSWNGLQALFRKECPYAYYVHCFAHRLQLALTAIAEKETSIWLFFSKLDVISNMFSSSSKRYMELQSVQSREVAEMVATGQRSTGNGANQMGTVHRSGATRWTSRYDSICGLIDMYSAVMEVFEHMIDECSSTSTRGEAQGCLVAMQSFDFVFILYLMHRIMGVTDVLSQALQHKSLDILNAMNHVASTKLLLQTLREEGFEILLEHVEEVCRKYDIEIPNMGDVYKVGRGRLCQQKDDITVEHHYRFDVFNATIDFQMEEIISRFNDATIELLKLSSALEPRDNFKLFQAESIYSLAKDFYPADFTEQEMHQLAGQLDHYRVGIIGHENFHNLSTLSELCQRLVETRKGKDYNLIDRLIRLVLTLPVSTATTERTFSVMKRVKSVLRNKMKDEYLSNSMVIHIERELTKSIDSDSVIDEFYTSKFILSQRGYGSRKFK